MRQTRRFVVILLIFVVVAGAVSLRSAEEKEDLVFAESLDMTAAVVDGKEITLADMAF